MPFKPSFEGEFPTLGWGILDWMMEFLASPTGGVEKSGFVPYDEQAAFVLNLYRLHPVTGRRVVRRAGLCRPRGWGKSPFVGAIGLAECIGPARFDGWDADGQPVGVPWGLSERVLGVVGGVSEDQVLTNTWPAMLEMAREGSLVDEYGVEPFDGQILVPGGVIKPVTAAANTVIGQRSQFVAADQTESWLSSNGGRKLFKTLADNAAKTGGVLIETPNAPLPGEGSVAEVSMAYAKKIAEGRAKDEGLLWDDREAPEVDLGDREALEAALRHVYGSTVRVEHPDGTVTGHVDVQRLVDEVNDPARSEEDYQRMFLNQKRSSADAFVQAAAWSACGPHFDDAEFWPGWVPPVPVGPDDPIVLGFDGSRKRKRGVTDATALVACRVSDGYAWPVRVWEEPDGPEARDWEVPEAEVEASVDEVFSRYRVVGFYADPSMWESNVARWEQKYGARLLVGPKVHPIAWNTRLNKRKTALAVETLRAAINRGELSHSGAAVLTRHVLNAIVHEKSFGPLMFKRTPSSADKIDAAYALTLAWAARVEALSKDLDAVDEKKKPVGFIPARIY